MMMRMMISEKTKKALSKAAVQAVGMGVSIYVIMAFVFDMVSGAAISAAVFTGIPVFVGLSFAYRRSPPHFGIGVASGVISKLTVTLRGKQHK